MTINISQEDFGTLCICAIRYCQGRQTYMPKYVQGICREHFSDFSDKDISVMLDDCGFQERMNLYGDERIDKPDWMKWKEDLLKEKSRRGEADDNTGSDCSEKPNRSEPKTAESGSVEKEIPEIKSNRTTGGMIYRQDAIDGAEEIIKRDTSGNNVVVKAMEAWKAYINNLPSAQPEIIRCKDCWHYPSEYADCPMIGWARNENDFCSKAERRTDEIN